MERLTRPSPRFSSASLSARAGASGWRDGYPIGLTGEESFGLGVEAGVDVMLREMGGEVGGLCMDHVVDVSEVDWVLRGCE